MNCKKLTIFDTSQFIKKKKGNFKWFKLNLKAEAELQKITAKKHSSFC